LKLDRILCPLDLSEFSATAFDYAQSLARHYHGKLFVQHVVQPVLSAYPTYLNLEVVGQVFSGLRGHAEEQLKELVRKQTRWGIPIEAIVQEGDVTETILALAGAREVDLIVMGTHGRRGLDHLLLGSITEKVLRKARCPVLAVRQPAHGFITVENQEDPVHLRKILLGVDFSTYSEPALRYALSLGQEYAAELTLLHVMEDFPVSADFRASTAEVEGQFQSLLPAPAQDECAIKTRVRSGRPYQEIVRYASEEGTDLVILGVRGRNAVDLAIFGSTTHRVIQRGPCPVLAVHI
jgi:nucleotide-binding universal stress UspA family protein